MRVSPVRLQRWGLVLFLGLVGWVRAEEPALRQLNDFWMAPVDERAAGLTYEYEVKVLYYDPAWSILLLQDESIAEYMWTRQPLPFRSGQRVRLRGRTQAPAEEFWIVDPEVEVLGEAEIEWTPINVRTADHRSLVNYPVEVEGLVEAHGFDGEDHLRLEMVCDGRRVRAWVLLDPLEPVPTLDGFVVRVRGVDAARFDAKGLNHAVDIFSPGLDAVTTVSLPPELPAFKMTAVPLAALFSGEATGPLKVQGRVVRIEDDGQAILRDETGQISLDTEQRLGSMLGQVVMAVGVPEVVGVDLRLREALVTPVESAENRVPEWRGARTRVLHRIAATALELSPEEAAKNHPVQLDGVVTWSSPHAMWYYLQDSSGGIGVYRANMAEPPPEPGRRIKVEGVTVLGDFAPMVQASQEGRLGEMALPRARRVTLEQALTGVEEAQLVEMTGYVHRARRDGAWARLEMTSTAGPMVARLPSEADVAPLVGAVISVRGVCAAITNEQRRLTGIELWVNDLAGVAVLDAGDTELGHMPTRSLAAVGRFSTAADLRRRIKVVGTVTHWDPAGWVHLEDEGHRLVVHTRQPEALAAGTRIEAAGFQGREAGRTVLRECIVKVVGQGTLDAPEVMVDLREVDPARDGRRVTVEGEVLERFRVGARSLLSLQQGSTVFECALRQTEAELGLPERGSRVRVTGVYEVTFDDRARPVGFRLLVDKVGAVTLLQPPRWWTRERVAVGAGIMIGGVLLALGWVWSLQRRVAVQAYEINEQIRRASQLETELQQALRLESLGTLAGSIAHDFNQKLSALMESLAGLLARENLTPAGRAKLEESRSSAIHARDLAARLLTFSKGGAAQRQPLDLLRLVTEELATFGLPANIHVTSRLANGCPPVLADPWQLKQILQNLLLNAVQAMPNGGGLTIEVSETVREESQSSILTPGHYAKLVVRDNGEGVSDRHLPQVFDPYFTTRAGAQGLGLAVVYTIVRRHGGWVTLTSKAMVGTEVTVWLPSAKS